MVKRDYWIKKILAAWKKRSIIWLSGVRRVGKTYLCQSIENIEYFDCELPRIRMAMADPELFLKSVKGKRIILDEIHRLTNPSELLKIAADHFPEIQIIATGSSTLGASKKFKDSLTGRKLGIHLTPLLLHEMKDFERDDIKVRLLQGGLPPFFLEKELPEQELQEWLTSYWAKDIQELFRLEKRHSFMKFIELIMAQSGSMFEASRFSSSCEVSRSTIMNYLSVLESTYIAYVVRPFSNYAATEIKSAPKVYAFDTGFVCHCRGWIQLRQEDLGHLWEHIILNELIGHNNNFSVNYWRTKQGHEIDFIISKRKSAPIAIECKWSASKFDANNLKIFRKKYPKGKNFVVAADVEKEWTKEYNDIRISFVSPSQLIDSLTEK